MQTGFMDAAGYQVNPQSEGINIGYPVQGLSPGGTYPSTGAAAPRPGYPATPYGASYPPPGSGLQAPPAGSSLPPMGGSSALGGMNTNELYAYAQQYGLSRGEVDAAVSTYKELSNMDRNILSSLGSGSVQNLLLRIMGGSAGNEQRLGSLGRMLTNTLSSGRLPSIKEFLTLIGTNKTQYGGAGQGGKYSGLGSTGGVGVGTGVGQQQYPQYPQAGMGQQQYPQYPPAGVGQPGMGQQQYPQYPQAGMGQQQYPPGGMGTGGMPPPYY